MFAKFSPDGRRVAYVRENNLYVENLADGRITQLTSDGSRTIINGTFDWVYEEELTCATGSAGAPTAGGSPTGSSTPPGCGDFLLINDTDSLYSFTIPVQYPKAGTTNSAARVGVVSAEGGQHRLAAGPRRPAQQLHRPAWTGRPARTRWCSSSSTGCRTPTT